MVRTLMPITPSIVSAVRDQPNPAGALNMNAAFLVYGDVVRGIHQFVVRPVHGSAVGRVAGDFFAMVHIDRKQSVNHS